MLLWAYMMMMFMKFEGEIIFVVTLYALMYEFSKEDILIF